MCVLHVRVFVCVKIVWLKCVSKNVWLNLFKSGNDVTTSSVLFSVVAGGGGGSREM